MLGGNGDDLIRLGPSESSGSEVYDGGAGYDIFEITGFPQNFSQGVSTVTLTNFEAFRFDSADLMVIMTASQLLNGFGSAPKVIATLDATTGNRLDLRMDTRTSVDLRPVVFENFKDSMDIVEVDGDGDAESMIGSGVSNMLFGSGGNDWLAGGGGTDFLVGGTGSDTVSGFYAHSGITLTLFENDNLYHPNLVDGFTLYINSIENAEGSNYADTLIGMSLANSLSGLDGNDTLTGLLGNDTLDGGNGKDTASYAEKTASISVTLNGALDAFVVVGGVNEDVVRNIEAVIGGTQGDKLTGDAKANALVGGGGKDTLRGGGGADRLKGDAGKDKLDGGTGSDTADYSGKSKAVSVTLKAGNEATVKVGDKTEDTIRNIENVTGGGAGDKLSGDSKANTFNGGAGKDTLSGDAGKDRFVFSVALAKSNVDTIKDFEHSQDKILLNHAIFSAIGSKLDKAEFYTAAGATQAHDKSDRVVYDSTSGKLYYDSDGKGHQAAVQFAVLSNHETLSNTDFLIV